VVLSFPFQAAFSMADADRLCSFGNRPVCHKGDRAVRGKPAASCMKMLTDWKPMKTPSLIAAAWMIAVHAFAQGQFYFTNLDRNATPPVDARFYGALGSCGPLGAGYTVTLFGGPAGSPTLTQLATTTFRTSPAAALGYVNPITVTVPDVPPGSLAIVRVDITGAQGLLIFSQPYILPLGGDTIVPPTLPMGNAPIVLGCPEPSTVALAALGLGALLLIRRRDISRK
jgi:MYXO-CTERM domain-containing protein